MAVVASAEVTLTRISVDETTQQHFWHDSEGAHVSVSERPSSGGAIAGANALLTSDGLEVRNGSSVLSEFGSDSASLLSGEFSIDAYSNYVRMRAFGAGILILGDEDYYSGINAYQNISFVSSIGCVTVSNGTTIQDNYSRASNRQAVGAKILFENASGSTGNVTLNETAANMSVIEIAYGDGTRHYTKRVYAPNGKYVTVDRQIFNANYYLAANNYLVSGTRMTYQAATTGQAVLSNGTDQTVNSTRQLKVYQVIGWR